MQGATHVNGAPIQIWTVPAFAHHPQTDRRKIRIPAWK